MATTITSLLNSLHTHLQSQTQLLPTLHAQLGLAETALTDELAELQERLTECIETQIDVRRKEVDEWMGKCDDVEKECLRYTRALGGHIKAAGTSVGEIRKEAVLPRRFDRAMEYQDKLRQMYHTKLEQLLTLTGRISQLAHTLGVDFYSEDILEPTAALDEDEDDPNSHRDVTPERFSKLEKELVRGKGEVSKRLTQLSAMLIQIDWLYTELGMEPPGPDEAPSSLSIFRSSSLTRPTPSRSARSTLLTVADPFLSSSISSSLSMSTPTPASRGERLTPLMLLATPDEPDVTSSDDEYRRILAHFVSCIEKLSSEELDDPKNSHVGLEGVDPTPDLIAWAEATRADLEGIKHRREAHIQAMYDQLEALWRRLGVKEAEMDGFVETQRGSTETTVKAYEDELERMLELKRERMSTFVENAREEIVKLWDELMIGDEERADFAPFADDEHTEELLSIHEEEIDRLKEERKLKGPLLTSIKRYLDICEDEKELAAAASDQSRLLGRGPRDPGRLLREEKMRKRVSKEKPRLEQDLLTSIPAWEEATGRVFLVHGQRMLQTLSEAVSANDKENNKRVKTPTGLNGSAPPRVKTPSNAHASHQFVPGKSTISATPANRPVTRSTSASQSVPAKRASRLGEATATHSNVPQRSGSRSTSGNTATSTSKVAAKTPIASSLPRATPGGMSTSKLSRLRNPPSHGRMGPARTQHAYNYHPYKQPKGRAAMHVAGGDKTYGAAAMAKKAARARRESFKPRPSVDDKWDRAVGSSQGRWAALASATLKEEDEDC
ncbi:uncharacterized protein LAESUDRAFT_729833 [Laetiporus sulphureus 93-53]|uniref:Microtubule associated protein n=1 Tax=Laetiporus sulphureus 93-53 TaxID=1314785 RepID=A0A165CI37_9APHY|nr:uncharacterized protein LAESUDRAFT_729833 [Laetiporus sulphureus 93-53]KZT02855.1 hypothetical protein LAESUDRAFT_729833 [Laetiporus sulphureus 93-53]